MEIRIISMGEVSVLEYKNMRVKADIVAEEGTLILEDLAEIMDSSPFELFGYEENIVEKLEEVKHKSSCIADQLRLLDSHIQQYIAKRN